MSDFIKYQLVCPNCANDTFTIINTGHVVCEKCRNASKITGRYEENGKEKILQMKINNEIIRSDDIVNRGPVFPRG